MLPVNTTCPVTVEGALSVQRITVTSVVLCVSADVVFPMRNEGELPLTLTVRVSLGFTGMVNRRNNLSFKCNQNGRNVTASRMSLVEGCPKTSSPETAMSQRSRLGPWRNTCSNPASNQLKETMLRTAAKWNTASKETRGGCMSMTEVRPSGQCARQHSCTTKRMLSVHCLPHT